MTMANAHEDKIICLFPYTQYHNSNKHIINEREFNWNQNRVFHVLIGRFFKSMLETNNKSRRKFYYISELTIRYLPIEKIYFIVLILETEIHWHQKMYAADSFMLARNVYWGKEICVVILNTQTYTYTGQYSVYLTCLISFSSSPSPFERNEKHLIVQENWKLNSDKIFGDEGAF